MNSAERVMAALRGEPVDRRPFSLVSSLWGARLSGRPLAEHYRDPQAYFEGQRAVDACLAPDILFGPFALALEAEAFGCELHHVDNAPPNVRRPAAPGAREWPRIRLPEVDEDPRLRYLVESVRLVASRLGAEKPVAAVLTAPVDLPAMLVGMEEWLDALLFRPESAQGLARLAAEHFTALGNALLAAGASFLVVPVMFANTAILTSGLVRDLVLPLLAEAFVRVRGPVVFHHGGNRITDLLHLYADLPNVVGYGLGERDSFARARETLGVGPVLLGNLSGPQLSRLSPARVEELAESLLAERVDDPRFILCSASADMPWDTPLETALAVRRAVERAGRGAA